MTPTANLRAPISALKPWTAPTLQRHGTVAELTKKAYRGLDGSKSAGVTSDREQKRDFVPADTEGVLRSLTALKLQNWRYQGDPESARHLGPTAQDFAAIFGLGDNDREIKVVDGLGVALAAIQALTAEVVALRERVAALEVRARDPRPARV